MTYDFASLWIFIVSNGIHGGRGHWRVEKFLFLFTCGDTFGLNLWCSRGWDGDFIAPSDPQIPRNPHAGMTGKCARRHGDRWREPKRVNARSIGARGCFASEGKATWRKGAKKHRIAAMGGEGRTRFVCLVTSFMGFARRSLSYYMPGIQLLTGALFLVLPRV